MMAQPAMAQKVELKPPLKMDESVFAEPTFKDEHPKVYKFTKPLRLYGRLLRKVGRKIGVNQSLRVLGDSAKWIGKKTEPYQPIKNLVTAGTNAAVSTGVWFGGR